MITSIKGSVAGEADEAGCQALLPLAEVVLLLVL